MNAVAEPLGVDLLQRLDTTNGFQIFGDDLFGGGGIYLVGRLRRY
jgi:hypothetical protein